MWNNMYIQVFTHPFATEIFHTPNNHKSTRNGQTEIILNIEEAVVCIFGCTFFECKMKCAKYYNLQSSLHCWNITFAFVQFT